MARVEGAWSLEEAITYPSLNIRGIAAGAVGAQARTIIPARAEAAIDIRLVKGCRGEAQVELLRGHLQGLGWHVVDDEPTQAGRRAHPRLVRLAMRPGGYDAVRTAIDWELSRKVIAAVRRATGVEVASVPSLGGSLPFAHFERHLGLPLIGLPLVNHDNNQHAPDENVRLGHLFRGFDILASLLVAFGQAEAAATADLDLVLHGGRIWTGVAHRPWADWVGIRGERIARLGDGAPPPAARSVALGGRLVVPGFNDSHVHFAGAGRLLLGVNLLDVNDDVSFRQRLVEAARRLPPGSWITGGDWGAYEAWAVGSDGEKRGRTEYRPTRRLIDDETPDHPVLVRRFDRAMGLANQAALQHLGIESATGILTGDELERALGAVPEPSFERRLAEARTALAECRRWGVTTVQDMSSLDQLEVYEHLRRRGEMTVRVHFSPSRLSDVELMVERGWVVGAGDDWLRFGTIKSHVDGIMGNRSARFFEPYADNTPEQVDWRGGWREFSRDLARFEQMLTAADAAGIQLRVHAIGDEANSLLLDILSRIEQANGARDRRFRLVHAQVLAAADFARLRRHNLVAEVQPYHCADDMRWMEERIGHERCRGAYAFRSLAQAGAVLAFGSDWPGTNASYYPVNPLTGLYAAVTRQTVEGTPEDGWFPEQRLSLAEALRAYTWGGAYASFEDGAKGTLEPGKLADTAVLDTDLFRAPPRRWLEARVDLTMIGGRIVYDRPREAGR